MLVAVSAGLSGGTGGDNRGAVWSLYKSVFNQHLKQPAKEMTTFGARNLLFALTACRAGGGYKKAW